MNSNFKNTLLQIRNSVILADADERDFADLVLWFITWEYLKKSDKGTLSYYLEQQAFDSKHAEDLLQIEKISVSGMSAKRNYIIDITDIIELGGRVVKKLKADERRTIAYQWDTFFDSRSPVSTWPLSEVRNLFDAFDELLANSWSDASTKLNPKDLVDLMIRLIEDNNIKSIHDPYCRTGNFLAEAMSHFSDLKLIVGYSDNSFSRNLAALRLLLLESANEKLVRYGSIYGLETQDRFDAIITNPPFGKKDKKLRLGKIDTKWDSFLSLNRYEVDYVCYALHHLTATGIAAIVVPKPFLSGTEPKLKALRQMIIENNFLELVIDLPPGLSYLSQGIKSAIIVFNKRKKRKSILFVDAMSLDSKTSTGQSFTASAIHKIAEYVRLFRDQQELNVPINEIFVLQHDEIIRNDFSFEPAISGVSIQSRHPANELWQNCLQIEKEIKSIQNKISSSISRK